MNLRDNINELAESKKIHQEDLDDMPVVLRTE